MSHNTSIDIKLMNDGKLLIINSSYWETYDSLKI